MFEPSGYTLAKGLITQHWPGGNPPAPNDIKVLISYGLPGTMWENGRSAGIKKFLKEYGVPDSNIFELDTTEDVPVSQGRIAAFYQKHPDINLHLSPQIGHAGAYQAAKQLGYDPDKVVNGGFDLIPTVLDGMEEGYIHGTMDQQPYLQGALPVIMIYYMLEYGMSAWDVNTGLALRTKEDLPAMRALEEKLQQ